MDTVPVRSEKLKVWDDSDKLILSAKQTLTF